MAQIGYGYGSEWQLLRFLGHHRDLFNKEISLQTGINGYFQWLDFGFADRRKSISGDEEIKGISFIRNLSFIDEITYKELEHEYKSYNINKIDNWQNWDAVLVVDKTIYLIEAKAHTEELKSGKENHGGKSEKNILRFMKEQLPNLPVSDIWLKDYYQLANRLATTALLNKHLNRIGASARTMSIYFTNGYEKRIVEGDKLYKTIKKDASIDEFKAAISEELETLDLATHSLEDLITPSIFIECLER